MPDGHLAGQRREIAFRENARDQAEVLFHHDGLAVAGRDACRFLAAVLQRLQAEVGDTRGVALGCPHTKDRALVFGRVVVEEGIWDAGEKVVVAHDAPLKPDGLLERGDAAARDGDLLPLVLARDGNL